jgi:hypothetical protein
MTQRGPLVQRKTNPEGWQVARIRASMAHAHGDRMEVQMSGDDGEKTFEGKWGTTTIHEDGSITADHPAAKVETNDTGSRFTLKKLTKVAIDNIVDVESHTIKTDDTATSHHIVFRGGGEARFSYRPNGKLLELSGTNLRINVSLDGVVTFSKGD